jgi:hypothetical protein
VVVSFRAGATFVAALKWQWGDHLTMGSVHAFPIARTHVGVERVARKIYDETQDHPESRIDLAVRRATRMCDRAISTGVPDDVAHQQAEEFAGMLGEWIETFEWQERQARRGGDIA